MLTKAQKAKQDLMNEDTQERFLLWWIQRILSTYEHNISNQDETFGEHDCISTFIFTFKDDSILRLDTAGNLYCENDYEDSYNIFY